MRKSTLVTTELTTILATTILIAAQSGITGHVVTTQSKNTVTSPPINIQIKAEWAHIDIAGTGYLKESKWYHQKYGSGAGVRLLTYHFLEKKD